MFLYKVIDKRIAQNKNCLIIVCGETGSGKSFTALAIAEALDPTFGIERVVFSVKDFMHLLNSGTLGKGNVIVFDEAGVGIPAREWYSISNKAINYILQTFRHENLIVIFTTPTFEFIDKQTRTLFHFYIETLKVNFRDEKVFAKVRQLQYNPHVQKLYYHTLVDSDGNAVEFNRFPKPSDALVDAYEEKKMRFTHSLKRDVETEIKQAEIKQKRAAKLPMSHYIDLILKNPSKFLGVRKKTKKKFVDVSKIITQFEELGHVRSEYIKRAVQDRLKL